MYSVFAISDLLSKVSLSSDGNYLRLTGEILSGYTKDKVDAMIPILALKSVTARGENTSKALAYPLNDPSITGTALTGQKYFVDIEIWDGNDQTVGPFTEAEAIASLGKVQQLEKEVWALNQRWPLSASRAQMVRQLIIPGGMPEDMTGVKGKREFASTISFENKTARAEWFKVARNFGNVLGMERATYASGSGYIMMAIDHVILAKPSKTGFDFVAISYSDLSAVRLSESNRVGWLKLDIDAAGKRHELAIGWALDPNNPLETWSVFAEVPLKSADAANFITSRLYRYLLRCWAIKFPIGTDLIATLEKLNQDYEKGTLAPEALATLVDGIVNRERMGSIVTYPLEEPEYK